MTNHAELAAGSTRYKFLGPTMKLIHTAFYPFSCRPRRVSCCSSLRAGDHLYRMDYMKFVEKHRETGADITVSALPMDNERASDFGLMKARLLSPLRSSLPPHTLPRASVRPAAPSPPPGPLTFPPSPTVPQIDATGRIVGFAEKPKGDALKAWAVDTTILGLTKEEAQAKPYIASMGIYVFKKSALLDLLNKTYPRANDFGSEIIPAAAEKMKVQAYLFNDYWEDIGTIKSFFDANLNLAKSPPNFEFYDATNPIYTSPRFLPPAKARAERWGGGASGARGAVCLIGLLPLCFFTFAWQTKISLLRLFLLLRP